MKRVVVTDHTFPDLDVEREALADVDAEVVEAQATSEAEVIDAARGADAILTQYAPITEAVLAELDSLSTIGRYGIGVDNVDLDAATARGVSVLNVPDYCIDEVATHALSLLLACVRKLPTLSDAVESGRWDWSEGRPIHRLRGQTLGLVAFGKIPRRLASMVRGFDLEVIAHDPYCPSTEFDAHGVRSVTFDELLAESDFVSIHAPLTDETSGLFDRDTFHAMKDSAILINTSRGPIVDVEALGAALRDGEIAGAGLDVLPNEPPDSTDLEVLSSVLVTPHVAWYSEESIRELRHTLAADVAAALAGKEPNNVVNAPEPGDS